ncbi:hypothetical protein PMEGAS70_18830 [Priestia megaterium]|uniref:Uncharacterized protein n=1 Tax=Priestia megaterium TaxID=1404 RepID=A0AAX6BJP7_PRIMG|nr:hypothetical protein ShirakiTB12_24640 [Priestia megaterium]
MLEKNDGFKSNLDSALEQNTLNHVETNKCKKTAPRFKIIEGTVFIKHCNLIFFIQFPNRKLIEN